MYRLEYRYCAPTCPAHDGIGMRIFAYGTYVGHAWTTPLGDWKWAQRGARIGLGVVVTLWPTFLDLRERLERDTTRIWRFAQGLDGEGTP